MKVKKIFKDRYASLIELNVQMLTPSNSKRITKTIIESVFMIYSKLEILDLMKNDISALGRLILSIIYKQVQEVEDQSSHPITNHQ